MTTTTLAIVLLLLFSVAPAYVAQRIGKPKNRIGWLWGLLLSWAGVVVVAVLPPAASEQPAMR